MQRSLCHQLQAQPARQATTQSRSRTTVVVAASKKSRQGLPLGFVPEDNSGRANIFAVEPKAVWTSSPRSDREARKGLGGVQGIGLALGLIALVGAATVFVGASGGGNELEATGEPLSAIAARIQASL